MYNIKLTCPKCGLPVIDVLTYTESEFVINCSNCGEIKRVFEKEKNNKHKPQETKRKLTDENYLFN